MPEPSDVSTQSALQEFVPNQLWCARYPVHYAAVRFDARMTVVRLKSGGLLLHSPGPITPGLAHSLQALGPVHAIVAPGNFHHVHVAACQERYPEARTFVCPGVDKRQPGLRFDALLSDVAPDLWSEELSQVLLQGTRIMNEVAFFHRESRTLILVDLVERFTDETPGVSWGLKVWFRPLGMWNAPKPAPEYWLFGFRDRALVRSCLERMLAWDFERLILAHGDLVTSGAREVVERAWRGILR